MCKYAQWLVALLAVVSVVSFEAHSVFSAAPTPPAQISEILAPQDNSESWPLALKGMESAVTADLTALGFETSGGYFDLVDINDCPVIVPVMGMCYAMNPAAPYVMPALKPWPEEFVDPATTQAFGDVRPGHYFTFRLDPREAILIFVEMPPPAKYFGSQTYLFTRQDSIDTTNRVYTMISQHFPQVLDIFFRLSPNRARILLLASLSNAINNVVIENQLGSSFGQHCVFIITPDQFMDRAMRTTLINTGVLTETIFTEPIPSSMRLGLDESADDFAQVIRYAMPDDPDLGQQWQQDLPLTVIRVRSIDSSRAPEPYPADFTPETRTVNSELGLMEDLDKLNNAVREYWGLPPLSRQDSSWKDHLLELQRKDTFDLVGPDCISNTMHCLADTQDTNYNYSVYLPLDRGELNAIVGTLGTETGNATYVGVGFTRKEDLVGFANITHEELKGTASGYANPELSDPDKFFVWYVGRDCSRVSTSNCTEISEENIPRGGTLRISIRNYVVPGHWRGPNTEPSSPGGPSRVLVPWAIAIPGLMYFPLIYKDYNVSVTQSEQNLCLFSKPCRHPPKTH